MPVILHEGLSITMDEDGFLARLEDWTEKVARVLAAREGIGELSDDKLDILKFLRTSEKLIRGKVDPHRDLWLLR